MKKFVNDPAKFVPEMLEGIALANPDKLKYEPKYNIIYRADRPKKDKVSVIQGSGSGHEPAHVMPQPPQFVLVFVGTHDEPQSIRPPLQAQVLPVQVAPAGHACPHDPQLALSVARFAQPVEHIISLPMHPEAQLPPLHTCGDVQVRPHMPQLALFEGTHMLLQESWPVPQTHAPA